MVFVRDLHRKRRSGLELAVEEMASSRIFGAHRKVMLGGFQLGKWGYIPQ